MPKDQQFEQEMIGRLPEPGVVIRNLSGRFLQGRPMSLPFLNFMVDISRATALRPWTCLVLRRHLGPGKFCFLRETIAATLLLHKSMRPNGFASRQFAKVLVSKKGLRDHPHGFAYSLQLQPRRRAKHDIWKPCRYFLSLVCVRGHRQCTARRVG